MPSKADLRETLRAGLDRTVCRVNAALRGTGIRKLEPVLRRIGRGERLPHWYAQLRDRHTLPNLDGKTIGSVIEMLFVSVLETYTLKDSGAPPMRINPARGIDLPDLDIGVKSPSENFCTSEPFFSAYQRLLGNEYDVLVLLTDYQTKKKRPPLKLQVIKSRYLLKTQMADFHLCSVARNHRDRLMRENEAWTKKMFRFLAYVNQSDWRAGRILDLMECMGDEKRLGNELKAAIDDFKRANKGREAKGREPIPGEELESLRSIARVKPLVLGVIDAADNWVVDVHKDAGRFPNDNEWERLKTSPLDGQIGMSFALQWRYNFGRIFQGEPANA